MRQETTTQPFIQYLFALVESGDRGTLADLRRGLSGSPGSVPAMFPYVAPWVPDSARNTWKEKVYYIIAAMFAYYQAGSGGKKLSTSQGNMGDHCRAMKVKNPQSGSFEARFSNLLKAHRDDLNSLLRQLLSQLKGQEILINWDQLFNDLTYWNNTSQSVQRQWANSYWRYQNPTENDQSTQEKEI